MSRPTTFSDDERAILLEAFSLCIPVQVHGRDEDASMTSASSSVSIETFITVLQHSLQSSTNYISCYNRWQRLIQFLSSLCPQPPNHELNFADLIAVMEKFLQEQKQPTYFNATDLRQLRSVFLKLSDGDKITTKTLEAASEIYGSDGGGGNGGSVANMMAFFKSFGIALEIDFDQFVSFFSPQ